LHDAKALVLAVGAITAHSQLFHPEFLLKTMKNNKCDTNVIGSLLLKAHDRRFLKVIEYCHDQDCVSPKPSKTLTFAFKIGQTPSDPEFASFGVEISQLDSVDEKKITKLELLVKNNIFVRNRLLFGCNWRADIISTIEMGLDSPTRVKNRLRCSYETSHRVFNEYYLAQGLSKSS
jgi:hypothetical protein